MINLKPLTPHDKTVTLRDGRILGYSEYGDPHGKPLFTFHGWPGSRLSGKILDKAAQDFNIRVIGIDRPGFGISDYKEHRTLLDWPDDVVELADLLKIYTFSIIGISGGGPYAAACAYKIPHRIAHAGIVVGLAPTYIHGLLDGMTFLNKLGWANYVHFPLLRNVSTMLNFAVTKYFPDLKKISFASKYDKEILTTIKKEYAIDALEPFRNGIRGVADELKTFTTDWGFSIADIQKKMYLWYGEDDKNVPIAMGKYYEKTLQHNQATFYPHEGHLIIVKHVHEILQTLFNT